MKRSVEAAELPPAAALDGAASTNHWSGTPLKSLAIIIARTRCDGAGVGERRHAEAAAQLRSAVAEKAVEVAGAPPTTTLVTVVIVPVASQAPARTIANVKRLRATVQVSSTRDGVTRVLETTARVRLTLRRGEVWKHHDPQKQLDTVAHVAVPLRPPQNRRGAARCAAAGRRYRGSGGSARR